MATPTILQSDSNPFEQAAHVSEMTYGAYRVERHILRLKRKNLEEKIAQKKPIRDDEWEEAKLKNPVNNKISIGVLGADSSQ